MNKPIYRIIDCKGRVLIPKPVRQASGMDYGDIVRLDMMPNGAVGVKKVALVEIGDKSPEAMEAYVHAAVKELDRDAKLSLAARLLELCERNKQ